jgi:hypothetical protein
LGTTAQNLGPWGQASSLLPNHGLESQSVTQSHRAPSMSLHSRDPSLHVKRSDRKVPGAFRDPAPGQRGDLTWRLPLGTAVSERSFQNGILSGEKTFPRLAGAAATGRLLLL